MISAQSATEFRNRGWLLMVADGMGAHLGGEEASRIAATRVPELYAVLDSQRSPPLALRRSMQQVNREIYRQGEEDPAFRGMGTTCSVLVLLPRGALIGHVGDSRIYRIRDGRIEQLSRDHSLAWEIAAAGANPNEGPAGVPKNIITRSMGPHDDVDIDLEGPFPIELGDQFILCSDGLSGSLRDEEIAMLVTALTPEEATAALVGLTLIRGAPDNTTVIVATAGPEEVSHYSRRDAAWPLEDDGGAAAARKRPWILLGIAATCLFTALLINPWSDLVKDGSQLVRFHSPIGSLICVGLALGCLAGSFIGLMMPPPDKRARVLAPGKQLGKGPYRAYDATPTAEQFSGILTSLAEAAVEMRRAGHPDTDRLQTVEGQCGELARNGDFWAATQKAAEGFQIFTAFVESGRGDDTEAELNPLETS